MNNIAIIGGSGFIGSRLIGDIGDQYRIINFDKAQSADFADRTVLGDVRDRDALSQVLKGIDAVVLLAAEHRDDVTPVSLYYDVNVQGMANVLEAMDGEGIRKLVFTSTVALYGMNRSTPPKETDQPAPFNDYGKSKLEAETLIKAWVAKGDRRNALVVRPTVVFGEGNRGNVYNLLEQLHRGRFIMIGNGRNRKSMAYVGNISAFFRYKLGLGFEGLEVYNYVDTPDLDMNTLVAEVCRNKGTNPPKLRLPYSLGLSAGLVFDIAARLTGRKLPISSIRIRKFCASTQVDASKVNRSDFVRPYSLADGLRQTLEHEFGGLH
jgi:nucleoside-diphosphate-sugar epimerase